MSPKWVGKCPQCGEWNTLEESKTESRKGKIQIGKVLDTQRITASNSVPEEKVVSSSGELDAVL